MWYNQQVVCPAATSPASNTQAYIGLVTGVLAMVVLLLGCTVLLMVRRGRKKVALLHKHTALVSSTTKPGVTINMKVYWLFSAFPSARSVVNTFLTITWNYNMYYKDDGFF